MEGSLRRSAEIVKNALGQSHIIIIDSAGNKRTWKNGYESLVYQHMAVYTQNPSSCAAMSETFNSLLGSQNKKATMNLSQFFTEVNELASKAGVQVAYEEDCATSKVTNFIVNSANSAKEALRKTKYNKSKIRFSGKNNDTKTVAETKTVEKKPETKTLDGSVTEIPSKSNQATRVQSSFQFYQTQRKDTTFTSSPTMNTSVKKKKLMNQPPKS